MKLETITNPPITPENNLGIPSVEEIFNKPNPFTTEELGHSLLPELKKCAVPVVVIGIGAYEFLKRAFKKPDNKER